MRGHYYASEALKNDKETALIAVSFNKWTFEDVSETLRTDPELLELIRYKSAKMMKMWGI